MNAKQLAANVFSGTTETLVRVNWIIFLSGTSYASKSSFHSQLISGSRNAWFVIETLQQFHPPFFFFFDNVLSMQLLYYFLLSYPPWRLVCWDSAPRVRLNTSKFCTAKYFRGSIVGQSQGRIPQTPRGTSSTISIQRRGKLEDCSSKFHLCPNEQTQLRTKFSVWYLTKE